MLEFAVPCFCLEHDFTDVMFQIVRTELAGLADPGPKFVSYSELLETDNRRSLTGELPKGHAPHRPNADYPYLSVKLHDGLPGTAERLLLSVIGESPKLGRLKEKALRARRLQFSYGLPV